MTSAPSEYIELFLFQHTKHYLSEFTRPQRIYVDTYEDDTPNTGLHTLEQLEAENRRRIARAEQTSDEFASPSTYYFVRYTRYGR